MSEQVVRDEIHCIYFIKNQNKINPQNYNKIQPCFNEVLLGTVFLKLDTLITRHFEKQSLFNSSFYILIIG